MHPIRFKRFARGEPEVSIQPERIVTFTAVNFDGASGTSIQLDDGSEVMVGASVLEVADAISHSHSRRGVEP